MRMAPVKTFLLSILAVSGAVSFGAGAIPAVARVGSTWSSGPLPAVASAERSVVAGVLPGPHAPAYGTYAWPVRGPVIRGFEAPPDPYSAGHRGIDIGAPFGTDIVAAQDGVVAFAGSVAGNLFISIDHPDGVRTTYSWVSAVAVAQGDQVTRGEVIGQSGHGHPEIATPHLHFGARVGTTYIDPLLLLSAGSVVGLIHLAPLTDQPSPVRPASLSDRGRGFLPQALPIE
jgi:murein DD-endopeptidase MepM/ murein hydrolase activator NlpD